MNLLPDPTDLTDAEWQILFPLIPHAKRGGRPRSVNMREIVNGIFVNFTGRMLVENDAS